uniref:LysM and putative peptidoglycan-binding domain-containing protein 4 n=1 Tax=Meleagris gallopavo TaxID=9103 RepID=G1NAP1_MELGA
MKNCLTSVLFQVLLYKMRLNESRTRPFQAPVSIHSYPGGQVYVFPNGRSDSEESSEEELNVMELRPRGRERPCSTARGRAGDVVLLEREITEDDSLNKLALQYGCKVADIKRVNNFIREQDLYALKSIKIPVKTHGLLTESSKELRPLPAARSQGGAVLVEVPEPGAGGSGSAESGQLVDYFKGIDKSIQDAVQAEARLNAEYCVEAPERPLAEPGKRESSNGADCGIQWWNAVFIMLLRSGSSAATPAAHSTQSSAWGDAAEGPWDMEHSSAAAAAGSANGEGQEAVNMSGQFIFRTQN